MEEEKSIREKRIKSLAISYYSRQDVSKAIFDFSKNREVVPSYMMQSFGKRPDALQYPSDIPAFVKKGATSFHCSEELWKDPLAISTEKTEEQLNELREGWDFLIDIDSKYLDYSKISAELIIRALEFHGVKNLGIKFSGSKGFHIIVPWRAFPEEIHGVKTKNMFPEWPRLICGYLNELIKENLIERISALSNQNQKNQKSYVRDTEAPKQVAPDILLVSSRHLFRMPYSLHEKTSLASVVIDRHRISEFQVADANPLKVQIKNFYPEPEPEEARELLIQAIDWGKAKEQEKEKAEEKTNIFQKGKTKKDFKEITIKNLSASLYPPCITTLFNGVKQDGRKRALFILINFFKSLKLSNEELEKEINAWNKKNYKPLQQGYINSQLSWHARQKPMLPPNCDKTYYKDLAVCHPDSLCAKIKNPVNYTIRKSLISQRDSEKTGKQ